MRMPTRAHRCADRVNEQYDWMSFRGTNLEGYLDHYRTGSRLGWSRVVTDKHVREMFAADLEVLSGYVREFLTAARRTRHRDFEGFAGDVWDDFVLESVTKKEEANG